MNEMKMDEVKVNTNMLWKIKREITDAMKSKDVVRRNILRLLASDAEAMAIRQKKDLTDDIVINAAKKIIAGIEETLPLTDDTEKAKTLQIEKDIVENYLPKTLSKEQIKEYINDNNLADQIAQSKNFGAAMGMVMKSFKENSIAVNGKDVKKIVEDIRS